MASGFLDRRRDSDRPGKANGRRAGKENEKVEKEEKEEEEDSRDG